MMEGWRVDMEVSSYPPLPKTPMPDPFNDAPPVFKITTASKVDETACISEFIAYYRMSTQTPMKFKLMLKYLPEEYSDKLRELGITRRDRGLGRHRSRRQP